MKGNRHSHVFKEIVRNASKPFDIALAHYLRCYDKLDLYERNLTDRLSFRKYRDSHQLKLEQLSQSSSGILCLMQMRSDLYKSFRQSDSSPNQGPTQILLGKLLHLFSSSLFHPSSLELCEVTSSSSPQLLNSLFTNERVHPFRDTFDFHHRLDSPNKCCFTLIHPLLRDRPLISLYAHISHLPVPSSITNILNYSYTNPISNSDTSNDSDTTNDSKDVQCITFYSISSMYPGLDVGHQIIQRTVQRLGEYYGPGRTLLFCTLSPIPGLRKWIINPDHSPQLVKALNQKQITLLSRRFTTIQNFTSYLRDVKVHSIDSQISDILLSITKYYLLLHDKDPVGRFHLGNGATIYQLNWDANPSHRSQQESWGIMVNYHYQHRHVSLQNPDLAH